MNSSDLALREFTRTCLNEARRAEFRGQRRMAAGLRDAASRAIEAHNAAMPTLVDQETAARQAKARAFAAVIANGLH